MPAATHVTPRLQANRVPAEAGASAEPSVSAETPEPAGMLISSLVIPGHPKHVPAARQFAALVLRVHSRDDDGTVGLLLTELISNSLAHSNSGKPGGTITVTVTVTPEKVVGEVADDGGDGEPVLRDPPGEEAERGRGLQLVDELSDGWGYFGGGEGRMVTWFEVKAGQPS